MAFESRSFPRYHWVRRIRNRNIASELVKVQPFIYTACCLNIEPSSAVEALEEPFAIFCVPVAAFGVANVSQSIKTYDGSVFIRTILSENADYDALRCRTRFRSHDSCFWFVRLLEYSVQYNEIENEFVLMVQFLSIIHEFHLREPVFAAMPSMYAYCWKLPCCNAHPI
ncbi:hypothetical protein P879_04777 [Paragonimus westermani]|uniref:Uncharacterized protein n=1 Tax=Paragonimus westermani TaxID=34504 RepID=A0A8T0DRR9_9TREM|nr:hypothetical protein P879_04777 [Paragonimus westermani]